MDSFRKREYILLNRAIQRAEALACVTKDAPQNMQIAYRAACLVWVFAQGYRSESSNYYVSRKRYNADVQRIALLEAEITEGAYKAQVIQAVSEAREYLSLVAEYRIRENRKCRVF